LLPLVCLALQALLAELEPLLGVWEQVLEWEGEDEGEVWQRRGRAVFWESLEKQEAGVGGCWEAEEVVSLLWEEEVVSLLWEAEGVFWMEEEEVFLWLGEVVVF
jgi:hypothetical protein